MSETQQDATPENDDDAHDWPVWATGYLAALRQNPSLSRAAEAGGIARSTALRLTQRDEAFALAVNDAREHALDVLEETIYYRANQGIPTRRTVTRTHADGSTETTTTDDFYISDTLAMFFLKRWRPEYRESYRVEQTGAGGGPIRVKIDAERLDDDIRSILGSLGSGV